MKKRVFSYIVFLLSVWTISAMDPTSPIQPTHKAPADKGLGLDTAHPEQTKCVEGRRDSNHAIAPKEQRRMDTMPLDQTEFQGELKLDDILTKEVIIEATKNSSSLNHVKPKLIILYNNVPQDDQQCSTAEHVLKEALSISSEFENPQDLEVSVNWQQLQSLFPVPQRPEIKTVIQRVAITNATPKTVILSNVQERQTPELAHVTTVLQKALIVNSSDDSEANVTVTADLQQLKQLMPQRTIVERFTDPVTLTTAAVVGLICWKLSASASE